MNKAKPLSESARLQIIDFCRQLRLLNRGNPDSQTLEELDTQLHDLRVEIEDSDVDPKIFNSGKGAAYRVSLVAGRVSKNNYIMQLQDVDFLEEATEFLKNAQILNKKVLASVRRLTKRNKKVK